MPLLGSERIERELLKIALAAYEEWGRPVKLAELTNIVKEHVSDVNQQQVIDALKRLHSKSLLSMTQIYLGVVIPFTAGVARDGDFFYDTFYLKRTEKTEPLLEELEAKDGNAVPKAPPPPGVLTIIGEGRLTELRAIASSNYDFKKLIRLCEEMDSCYSAGNYLATAMLTRALLDHVPPLFGKTSFAEVANNYGGGGKSFKDAMQHLENASRKVADGHLHVHIRNSETLPTPQQVHCAQQLDLLLAEIVRIKP